MKSDVKSILRIVFITTLIICFSDTKTLYAQHLTPADEYYKKINSQVISINYSITANDEWSEEDNGPAGSGTGNNGGVGVGAIIGDGIIPSFIIVSGYILLIFHNNRRKLIDKP